MSLPPVRAPGKRLRARQREAWPRANPSPKAAARGPDPHLPARPRQAIFGSLERGGRLAERENQQLYSEAAGKFLADRFVTGTCPFCAYEVRPCPRPGRPRARDALAPACMRATPATRAHGTATLVDHGLGRTLLCRRRSVPLQHSLSWLARPRGLW